MRAVLGYLAVAVLLAGCAASPTADRPGEPPAAGRPADTRPAPPSLGFLSRIEVPGGQEPALQLAARGVQIFRCERLGDAFEWRFRQPEAELVDAQGQAVGRHGANFSFEHRDGSRLLGTIVAHDKAASADTVPWLLLSVKSYGKGEFGGISYVQRVNTRGGMPPSGCGADQANRLLRVEFSADFVFYRPRG
jgi:Protein of unknown function (DUF3455)